MQKKVEKIIREVAERWGKPYEVVAAMWESQFHCARQEAKSGEKGKPETFKNVRFRYLGLLAAKKGRINILQSYDKSTKNSEDNQG